MRVSERPVINLESRAVARCAHVADSFARSAFGFASVRAAYRRFGLLRGAVVDRSFVAQRLDRNIRDDFAPIGRAPAAVVGNAPDHYRMQIPLLENGGEFGLASAFGNE